MSCEDSAAADAVAAEKEQRTARVESVFDTDCLISPRCSVSIGSGAVAQMLHANDPVISLRGPRAAGVCNSMWALTDSSEDREEARLVPDSHVWDRSPDPRRTHQGSEMLSATMERDSIPVRRGSGRHGGGTSHTSEPPIATNSCTSFIRPPENRGDPRAVRNR